MAYTREGEMASGDPFVTVGCHLEYAKALPGSGPWIGIE
jgi:hypothetical protein